MTAVNVFDAIRGNVQWAQTRRDRMFHAVRACGGGRWELVCSPGQVYGDLELFSLDDAPGLAVCGRPGCVRAHQWWRRVHAETSKAAQRVVGSAQVSVCGTWRYQLERRWGPGRGLLWVLLNPSTADAQVDDQTVRRVVSFTRAGGFDAATVVNLYALRSAHPEVLSAHCDPVGPDNDRQIRVEAACHDQAIVAWGNTGVFAGPAGRLRHWQRIATVEALLETVELRCLGWTCDGHPRHPVRMAAAASFEPYDRRWLR